MKERRIGLVDMLGSRICGIVLGGTVLCAFCSVFLLSYGSVFASLSQLPAALWGDADSSDAAFVVQELRLPRALMGLLVGAALGTAGAIMQAITRNPLGDPSLTGVTGGAAAAVVFAFLILNAPVGTLMFWGTLGGVSGAAITFSLARQTNYSPIHMTLAGMAVSLFCLSLIHSIVLAKSQSLNSTYFWLIGNLANRTWQDVGLVWPLVVGGLAGAIVFSSHLNVLMLDEDSARARGLAVTPWRLFFGMVSVILTAGCVATCGPISFIGLVAPHLARQIIGAKHGAADHRVLLPVTALLGAFVMSLTDALSVSRMLGSEVPTGLLSILVGGAAFLLIFKRRLA